MSFTKLCYEVKEQVAYLTLNSPENYNAMGEALCYDLLAGLRQAEQDPAVKVIVLQASGKAFCSGGDLKFMQQQLATGGFEQGDILVDLVGQAVLAIKKSAKPVIASVQGAAAGAGANLAFACDFCLAAENAKFIQAFVKVGLIPDAGGIYLLTKALGVNQALQLAMTGDALGAQRAYELGVVYEVCPVESLSARTAALAQRLAAGPAASYRYMKEMCIRDRLMILPGRNRFG